MVDRYRTAQPRPLKDRQHDLFGGSRVGRTLEHDKLARAQVGADLLGRVPDVGKVRLAVFVERRGDANQAGVHGFERGEIVRGSEMLLFDFLRDGRRRNVADVTFPPLELLDLGGVDVKAGGRESLAREQEREG